MTFKDAERIAESLWAPHGRCPPTETEVAGALIAAYNKGWDDAERSAEGNPRVNEGLRHYRCLMMET